MALFREIVLDVWSQRTASVAASKALLEGRLSDLRNRESRLEEAFLYEKAIDRETYERQRDKLRNDRTIAETEVDSIEQDDLDVGGLFTFAEHVLLNAGQLWRDADSTRKQTLQRAILQDGLRFQDGRFGTAATLLCFQGVV